MSIPCKMRPTGAAAVSSVGSWAKVLTRMLSSSMSQDDFDIVEDASTKSLTVMLHLNVPLEEALNAQATLPSAVPSGISVSVEWISGLPISTDYTPLEYLDISKEFTHDSIITTNALDVQLDAQFVYNGYEAMIRRVLRSAVSATGEFWIQYFIPSYTSIKGLLMVNNGDNREYFPIDSIGASNLVVRRYGGKIPSYTTRKKVHIHDCGYDMDGKFYQFEPTAIINNVNWGKMVFGSPPTTNHGNHWRIWRCTVRQNGVMTADLVPCTRVSDGSLGLWCNVYNKFYQDYP